MAIAAAIGSDDGGLAYAVTAVHDLLLRADLAHRGVGAVLEAQEHLHLGTQARKFPMLVKPSFARSP